MSSVSKHAKKLAIIAQKSYDSLKQFYAQLDPYLDRHSKIWNIPPINLLDTYIQFFIYICYKTYIRFQQPPNFVLIRKTTNNLIIDNHIPSEITNSLISPLFDEIRGWDLPDKREIDAFFTFYGSFLRNYKPTIAKNSGIVYTPKIIVDFMIKGIQNLIIHLFKVEDGLKNREFPFKIIDPASGTMNFIIALLNFVKNSSTDLGKIYSNILTMELNSIPYLLGLDELMNIIEFPIEKHNFHLGNTLTKESYKIFNDFLELGQKNCLSIIMGNPPYYINTQNNYPWIQSELSEYKQDLAEKNLKILSDDYVKFFRVSQKLFQEKNRQGILTYVSNNNFLDGTVFKSMRKSLLETFNAIYIVNLHGNLRKKETGNPFKIKIGISIIFLVRNKSMSPPKTDSNSESKDTSKIYYLDLNSPQLNTKFTQLAKKFDMENFQRVNLTPDYFFIPRDMNREQRFQEFTALPDLFQNSPKSGIMTGRDSLVSNPDVKILEENLQLFFHRQFDKLKMLDVKVNKTKTWDPEKALISSSLERAKNSIIQYYYRGFVKSYLIYEKNLVDGCRLGYLDTISSTNPAICVTRSIRSSHFSHVLMVDAPPEKCLLGIRDSSYVFLLKTPQNLKKYNLSPPSLGFNFKSEMLFYYIYGILYSCAYRERYVEQLRRHFPRIPFLKNNPIIFEKMVNLGMHLANIHLDKLDLDLNDFVIYNTSNRKIQDFHYERKSNRLFFGSHKDNVVIEGITPEIWDFEIGSIRQLEYWLKSRKYKSLNIQHNKRHLGLHRPLDESELKELLKLCSKIKLTLGILPKIDAIYKKIDEI
ncbi:MAG: N-6 DNA methylase [Candidatus Lokiarchaeota archaeon]|nr:N-6 DNA methylase [Candidatus Lokiarchaeota archaeon]